MSNKNSSLSDHVKEEAANELGVQQTVKTKGWGDVSSKDCGNIVKKAMEISERNGDKK
ncbi:MAG TPA: small, acid-soluble spore protein, alpha/beta type [Mobilitalea sp.]|nr:small, acid-soluble spore protein, alpha/beta type [Mobilitalea sp.]